MVLAELSTQITNAFQKLHTTTVIDNAVIEEVIKDIVRALLSADVNVKLVQKLQENVKAKCVDGGRSAGTNKRKFVQKTVIEELIRMLSFNKTAFTPTKNRSNVIMFVGLQGAGKTTTCTKLAVHYQQKGWKVGLICADTFRAGAFDQLKQNAAKAKIPFYGSYNEVNAARVAANGVKKFKAEKYEIIIVDTSGRHQQEQALFEEMRLINEAVKPDEVIFVMDSHIGQSCHDHAKAFSEAVDVGSVIITKLDGHGKGGGAIAAVAATGSPITFLGTGEHFEEFEPFEARSFVSRFLGLGDISGLINTIKEVVNLEGKQETIERLSAGKFTLRDMYEQFDNLQKMGPIGKVMSMFPGISPDILNAGTQDGTLRIKRFMVIMDSMTNQELDCEKGLEKSRILRIARGSGSSIADVEMLMDQYKLLQKMVGNMGRVGLNKESTMQNMMRNPQQMLSRMQNAIDPRLLNQMGGAGNLLRMMKDFQGEGMGNMFRQMTRK
ncbi:bifunctional Signal recognition particle [Babesia duncani]|uniref:Signal recognition particle 54 kDa protein n=1 Tax=Babesia duncani TaxID=323732 RepID=A0AAD9UPD9_9APIC|nr:bifunctional Signal recognition particle [Babesia duncani]